MITINLKTNKIKNFDYGLSFLGIIFIIRCYVYRFNELIVLPNYLIIDKDFTKVIGKKNILNILLESENDNLIIKTNRKEYKIDLKIISNKYVKYLTEWKKV